MIYHLRLDFNLYPKPRGNIGKTKTNKAFIYHSTTEYTRFKKQIKLAAKKAALPGKNSWSYPIGISIVESFVPFGTESDLDNCLGGLLDALVQGGYLIDDSRKYLQKIDYQSIESDIVYCFVLVYPMSDFREAQGLTSTYHEAILNRNQKSRYVPKYWNSLSKI